MRVVDVAGDAGLEPAVVVATREVLRHAGNDEKTLRQREAPAPIQVPLAVRRLAVAAQREHRPEDPPPPLAWSGVDLGERADAELQTQRPDRIGRDEHVGRAERRPGLRVPVALLNLVVRSEVVGDVSGQVLGAVLDVQRGARPAPERGLARREQRRVNRRAGIARRRIGRLLADPDRLPAEEPPPDPKRRRRIGGRRAERRRPAAGRGRHGRRLRREPQPGRNRGPRQGVDRRCGRVCRLVGRLPPWAASSDRRARTLPREATRRRRRARSGIQDQPSRRDQVTRLPDQPRESNAGTGNFKSQGW